MSIYVLHGMAALLWALAIVFAGAIGMALEQDKHRGLFEMLAILAVLSGVAFTLQVMA